VRLYVLISQIACKNPWLQTAEQAILGGADCLQLREKDLDGGEFLARAVQLVQLCRRHQVLCIINDRPDIALLSNADGVHVGQEDLPAAQVRKMLGPEKILGVSTHRLEQAKQAVLNGATYLGVGPVFPSQTKPRDFLAGLDYVRQVASAISLPAVAISGINETNVDEVIAAGLRRIAVASAITAADDVRRAAEQLKEKLRDRPPGDKDG
jgi:thiamine-phosphate pyrophosphorylase